MTTRVAALVSGLVLLSAASHHTRSAAHAAAALECRVEAGEGVSACAEKVYTTPGIRVRTSNCAKNCVDAHRRN